MAVSFLVEDAIIGMKNFEGRPTPINKAGGDRSFVVYLDEERAQELLKEGWNVKWPKPRPEIDPEEDNRSPFLPVTVAFQIPPKIYMVNTIGETQLVRLEEEDVASLDWDEFERVDLKIRPYHWTVKNETGVKAYLEEGFFTLQKSGFSDRYGV